jgi:flagellar FliL protein
MAKAALKSAPPPPKEQEAPQPIAKAQKAKKKSRGKLFWIGLLLFSIAAGGASWLLLGHKPAADAAAPPPKPDKPPTFVNLETFTVNLQPEVGEQYLEVTLTVKTTDDGAAEAMKLHMPEIRNRLLLLLSSKRPSELLNTPGKVQLATEILGEVRMPVPEPLRQSVAAVYFTSFVIQ